MKMTLFDIYSGTVEVKYFLPEYINAMNIFQVIFIFIYGLLPHFVSFESKILALWIFGEINKTGLYMKKKFPYVLERRDGATSP
jgi:hypothetical protein